MANHGVSFKIVWRNADNTKRTWQAKCACRSAIFEGPEYELVEDDWRKHVYDRTGNAPSPCGNKDGRWTP